MNQNDARSTAQVTRIKCPECGIEMNPHAEKRRDPRSSEEAARMDTALGGLIEEVHMCPECGHVEARLT